MIFLDIETDGIKPTKIHFIVVKSKVIKPTVFFNKFDFSAFLSGLPDNTVFVFHNGMSYDSKVLHDLWGINLDKSKCIDTYITSKLKDYSKFRTHSLDEIGQFLGEPKLPKPTDWSVCTDEMVEYGKQDVVVLEKVYNYLEDFIKEPKNKRALRTEHDFQWWQARSRGFHFDLERANELLSDVKKDILKIDFSSQKEVKNIEHKIKYNKDGELSKRSLDFMLRDNVYVEGDTAIQEVCEPFNPGSHKQRIQLLNKSGWKPTEPTPTYLKKKREGKLDERTKLEGWKVNEANLNTLPSSAPEEAKQLAQWITLDSRRQSLEEYIRHTDENSILKGDIYGIGAWTHRCAHTKPNTANIVSCFDKTPKTEVEKIKAKYDTNIRKLFKPRPGRTLLGVDAKGIQLRLLAHYSEDEEFIKEVCDPTKDIHQTNASVMGVLRDNAKTFIYAWILNAGLPKLAEILNCTIGKAKIAKNNFEKRWCQPLKKINLLLDKAEAQGGFYALDGRWIKIPNRHKALAGMLQSGEAIIMKNLYNKLGLLSKRICTFPHDEFQISTSLPTDYKKYLSKDIKEVEKELELRVPLELEFKEGNNWAETH
jgi:DNA polymerase I